MNTNNCHDVETLLGPYLDSELDAKTSLELSVHLKECPSCAARLVEEAALQKRLKAAFTGGPLTEGLWGPIEERVRAADQRTASVSRGLAAPLTRFWRYWLWPSPRLYAGLAAAWAVILAVQIGTREPSRGGVGSTPETRTALAEQRHLLAELLGTNGAEPEPVGNTPQPPQTDARQPGRSGPGHRLALNPPSPALRAPSPIGWERDRVRAGACIGLQTWSSAAHHLTT